MSATFPHSAPLPLPPALATPGEAEARRNLLERETENYLAALSQYCNDLPTLERLGPDEFRFAHQVRQALDALLRLDEATEELLAYYRQVLSTAQQLAAAQVPSLERALGLPESAPKLAEASHSLPAWALNPNPTPAELRTEREADPVYRLGFVRGRHQGIAQTEARYEHLVSLYAQYAILLPPPSYTPSPLVARLNTFLTTPDMQARAALPLEQRQALAGITINDLQAHGAE